MTKEESDKFLSIMSEYYNYGMPNSDKQVWLNLIKDYNEKSIIKAFNKWRENSKNANILTIISSFKAFLPFKATEYEDSSTPKTPERDIVFSDKNTVKNAFKVLTIIMKLNKLTYDRRMEISRFLNPCKVLDQNIIKLTLKKALIENELFGSQLDDEYKNEAKEAIIGANSFEELNELHKIFKEDMINAIKIPS